MPRRRARPTSWPIIACSTPTQCSVTTGPFLDSDNNRVMVRVTGGRVTTSIIAMRTVVLAGLGLWPCPTYIVSDLLASGQLVRVLKVHPNPEMESVALYPYRRYITAKVRVFIDMLVERFADEQRWLDATSNR